MSREEMAKIMNKGEPPDINKIMRRAEQEISYSAKRAVEMYYPVWEKQPAMYLFDKCAEHYHLSKGAIEQCKNLMIECGMGDL